MDADERLNRVVLALFRRGHRIEPDNADVAVTGDPQDVTHLRGCDGVSVVDAEGYNGSYGCETGCEYVRLHAVVRCVHGSRVDFTYGEFGDLEMLFDQMDAVSD